MKKAVVCVAFIFASLTVLAQENLKLVIADSAKLNRAEWQNIFQIQNEQKRVDFADGVKDTFLNLDDDMVRSRALSNAIFKKTDQITYYVLNNFDDHEIIRTFLNGLIVQLKNVNNSIDQGFVDITRYKRTFEQTYELAQAIHKNEGAYYIKNNATKELYTLEFILSPFPELTKLLLEETANRYPEILWNQLRDISPDSLADKVVRQTTRNNPKLVLNYATSTAIERDIVRRNKDPYVKSLIEIADKAKTPLKAVYFLSEFHSKKLTIADLDKITDDRDLYFTKLVTQLNASDNEAVKKRIGKELNQETKYYVQQMNELHFATGDVRFKCVSPFSANEMYYLITEGDDEFYTSSYTGLFSRFMGKMKPKEGYTFLKNIGFNKFRTFIRLCGNFNTLADFLQTFKKEEKEDIMKMFVGNLDGDLEQSLEGAIDVATTFSSLKDSALQALVIEEVQHNRNKAHLADNRLAYRIYNILNILFTQSDSAVSAQLNVPPISSLPKSVLQNDSGVVVQQIFFPGDGDGKGVFNGFMRRQSTSKWKLAQTENWVSFESKGPNKIIKFANKPLDEPQDEMAQKELQKYLIEQNLKPSIIIQRGHSYHVATALDQLTPTNRIIVLGACGGFNHLETIMSKSPDAQIISTKQVGSGSINWPILDYLDDVLLAGKDIDWVQMWSDLGKQFGKSELFDDYVPPHKNLGSLFLKAFYRAELEEVE